MRIGIAGAGLAGRLLAWQLLRTGYRVALFDRDSEDADNAAGFIAAAMLAPCSEVVTADPVIYEPGLSALCHWPQWLAGLQSDSGIAVDYQQRGSVVVAHRADQTELDWFFRRLKSIPQVPSEHFQPIDGAQLRQLEPELSTFESGLYLPNEGCLDNRALFRALAAAIHRQGADWHCGQDITEVDSGRLVTDACSHEFDLVLDCRGFGGKPQLENFRGVRGEVLWVKAPEVNLSRPVRLIHPRYQLYIAPKPDHTYVIGATEIESESRTPVTVRSSLELLSALYSVHPGFAEGAVLEARANCRPAFANNLPKIIRQPGLMQVNGLYRHGYLLAPALVNSVLALIGNRPVQSPVHFEDKSSPEQYGSRASLSREREEVSL